LCPQTPRSAPLEAGVRMCVAEIQAAEKPPQTADAKTRRRGREAVSRLAHNQ
jgi:hypothetical protein